MPPVPGLSSPLRRSRTITSAVYPASLTAGALASASGAVAGGGWRGMSGRDRLPAMKRGELYGTAIALAALIITGHCDSRADYRAATDHRQRIQSEAAADRAAIQSEAAADRAAIRAKSAADRAAIQAEAAADWAAIRADAAADRAAIRAEVAEIRERLARIEALMERVVNQSQVAR